MIDEHDDPRRPRPSDLVEEMRRLAVLRDLDELTEAEFQQAKAKVVSDRRSDQSRP